ncbi:putative DNA binding protein [Acinetobacter baumannii]|nr:putative DNA binding protein [Acinetobacter baumannii]
MSVLFELSVRLEYLLMKPDISELSVEELKRLQEEAEALIASGFVAQTYL